MKQSIVLLLCGLIGSVSVFAQIRTDFDRSMNQPVEPFKIIDNIYYVGASDVTVFLLTSDEGHILIDGGFAETVPMVEANIKSLGFELSDIKILLNNHAHSDHAGGLAMLKQKTGARLYASKRQAKQLKRGGKKDFAFADRLSFAPVKVNENILDGDTVKLGSTSITAHFTPGHTKGAITFTTVATQDGKDYSVVFLSSTSALNYDLLTNQKYKNHAAEFEATFRFLRSLKADIFLGSHASFFEMETKRLLLKNEAEQNPFYDPEGYKSYIERSHMQFRDKLSRQKEKSQ